MHTTPVSLLERLRRPAEHEAWARFVQLYTPLLFHWARQVGLHGPDAADLVQDVLTLLVRKLPQFTYDRRQSFRAWLRTVTLNTWRERRRRPALRGVEGGDALADVPDETDLRAFEEAEYRRHLLHQALQGLRGEFPPLMWQAFWEYVVVGRDAKDVAAALGIRLGTVYAAKSRILIRLRHELQGLLD